MANPFTYKDIMFPLGGLDRKLAYQTQPPYTTLDAMNVRPYRIDSRRMSGGSRPGLVPWADKLGGKINMLALGRGRQLKFHYTIFKPSEDGEGGYVYEGPSDYHEFTGGGFGEPDDSIGITGPEDGGGGNGDGGGGNGDGNGTIGTGTGSVTPIDIDNPPPGILDDGVIITPVTIYDDFEGSVISSRWSRIDTSTALPKVDSNPPNGKYASPVGAVWEGIKNVDFSKRMQVEVGVGGVMGYKADGTYSIFIGARSNGATTIIAKAILTIGESIDLAVYNGSTLVESRTLETAMENDVLRLRLEGNGSWTASYGEDDILSGTYSGASGANCFGFQLDAAEEGCVAAIDYIRFSYYPTLPSVNPVEGEGGSGEGGSGEGGSGEGGSGEGGSGEGGSGEGGSGEGGSGEGGSGEGGSGEGGSGEGGSSSSGEELEAEGYWYLDEFSEFPVAAYNGDIYEALLDEFGNCIQWNAPENDIKIQQQFSHVMAQQRLRELFIADYGGVKARGTVGSITISDNVAVLSASNVTDWTKLGIVEESDAAVISDPATGVVAGEYLIESVETTGVVLRGYTGVTNGTCTFEICITPKVYRHDEGNCLYPMVATKGAVPVNCPLVCLYRDRLVFAGAADTPHLWYMSREGDPYDWDYVEDTESDATDYGIAVAGENADAGIIGQPIRALIPHSDDYLVFGYDTQLWILRGDPAAGGQLDCISRSVGIAGARAWCYGPKGDIYFMSVNGIHKLAYGGSSVPQVISYAKIPKELVGHSSLENVQMSYDRGCIGIHIFIEGANLGWFFSVENESFWPVRFASNARGNISALCEFGSRVLFGCVDGKVRVHVDGRYLDDSKPFTSTVLLGPVRLGRDDYGRGILQKMDTTFCGTGIPRMWLYIYAADEPVAAAAKYQDTGVPPDKSVRLRKQVEVLPVRLGSGCAYLVMGISAEQQVNGGYWWGMERIGTYIKAAGRFRE